MAYGIVTIGSNPLHPIKIAAKTGLYASFCILMVVILHSESLSPYRFLV
jgi:hypothetical protein